MDTVLCNHFLSETGEYVFVNVPESRFFFANFRPNLWNLQDEDFGLAFHLDKAYI